MARDQVEGQIAEDHDMLLFSGGASVGDYDITARLLIDLGYEIHCDKVNIRPGRPLIFATRGDKVAFGIPGNPVSHFVCYQLFIERALGRMQGCQPIALERAFLAGAVPGKPNPRVTFWPGRVEFGDGQRRVVPIPWNSSGHLAALAGIDTLIRLGSREIPEPGILVECLMF